MRKKKLGSRALGRRGPTGGGSEQPAGGRGRARKALAACSSRKRQVAGSAAARRPGTTQGDSTRVAPGVTLYPAGGQASSRSGPRTPLAAVVPYAALHPPGSGQPASQESLALQPAPGYFLCPGPPPAPCRLHLRGAPVAEFIGDGLNAPGPGHRDVAALGAHVQPHHRHDWLAVRLRPGSTSASSGRQAGLRWVRPLLCQSGAPASRGQRRSQRAHPQAGGAEYPRAAPVNAWIRNRSLPAERRTTDSIGEVSTPLPYVLH